MRCPEEKISLNSKLAPQPPPTAKEERNELSLITSGSAKAHNIVTTKTKLHKQHQIARTDITQSFSKAKKHHKQILGTPKVPAPKAPPILPSSYFHQVRRGHVLLEILFNFHACLRKGMTRTTVWISSTRTARKTNYPGTSPRYSHRLRRQRTNLSGNWRRLSSVTSTYCPKLDPTFYNLRLALNW